MYKCVLVNSLVRGEFECTFRCALHSLHIAQTFTFPRACVCVGMTNTTFRDTFQTQELLIGDGWCNWEQKPCPQVENR